MVLVRRQRHLALTLDEFLRGYISLSGFVKNSHATQSSPTGRLPRHIAATIAEAARRIRLFEKSYLCDMFRDLSLQINDVLYQYDRRRSRPVVPRRGQPAGAPSLRRAVGRGPQETDPGLSTRRGRPCKAYACERTEELVGLHQMTWNPARLGSATWTEIFPCYVSHHAISRLHERVPWHRISDVLHSMMYRSLDAAAALPGGKPAGFSGRGGPAGSKLGYFLVELYSDFIFVRTFFFLTMQGTPEAKCLRRGRPVEVGHRVLQARPFLHSEPLGPR